MFSRFARQAALAASLLAWIAPALAQAPSPVPALPDAERRTSYSISSSTCQCAVNFAIYGDAADFSSWIEVWLNGARVNYNDASLGWTITSPSNADLSKLARPITNAVLTFNQVQTGTVQIVGARRPRRVSQFTENRGVAARDLNQAITDIVAMLREDWDKINDVSGRAVLAPPGETLSVLSTAATRASSGACFDSGGQLVSCVSIPSTTFTAGNGITITGTSPKTITNNIQASAPIVISGTNPLTVSCPTCNTSPAAASPAVFVASRANAITLDLHTYTVVRTGGYTVGGDSGDATFKNVGSAPFIDTRINTGNLTAAGTGCSTPGTYLGVPLTGGTGTGAIATIIVAGGSVTTVTITGTGGNAFTAGDVLSAAAANIGGGCAGFTWTVSTVTSPTGSFTDSAGTHWQIVVDEGNYINVRQFGSKVNFTVAAGDAGSNDDTATNQNALNFAGAITPPTIDAGGVNGQTVLIPRGLSLSGALQVPNGVTFKGQGPWSSGLKMLDALSASLHFITLCDPTTHAACFGTYLQDMLIFTGSGSANANISAIYSNNIQEQDTIRRVSIFPGQRVCIYLEQGFGGASQVNIENIYCIPRNGSVNAGIQLVLGGSQTLIGLHNITVAGGSLNINAIQIIGGYTDILNFHCEGIVTCVFINVPANSGLQSLHNVIGGAGCTDLVVRAAAGTANVNVGGRLAPNGCTHTINNGGTITTGNVVADTVF
ncbi:hypothetical protein [Bradyrhizobium sp. LTSP857]|uniref:hypothetical protein n=1 Tax=Bradyrhizobium sp. LTSP857 TaxID=1619231 RepID=UPI0005E69738|nr:hypothetical protein [Bradyrhizobium sp. LTSP857]KJC37710.1 hypothetical protein UP06_30350 [Bradyrhizobium sp. LTSP857]